MTALEDQSQSLQSEVLEARALLAQQEGQNADTVGRRRGPKGGGF